MGFFRILYRAVDIRLFFMNCGFFLWVVLIKRALLFGVHMFALDFENSRIGKMLWAVLELINRIHVLWAYQTGCAKLMYMHTLHVADTSRRLSLCAATNTSDMKLGAPNRNRLWSL